MPALTDFSTTDIYTPAGELRFLPAEMVTITVTNAPVMAQFAVEESARHPEAASFDGVDRKMLLALYTWTKADFLGRRIVGVKLKSAVPGSPGIVTVSA